MKEPKLCKDCEHCLPVGDKDHLEWTCVRDTTTETDFVQGGTLLVGDTRGCYAQRREEDQCGTKGQYWKAKESE